MAAVKISLAAMVASLFGNSEKAISEKLSSEEFNQFTTDAQAAAQRITELENEKATADTTIANLTTRATTAENALTEKANRITELEGSVTSLEADRDKYKAWFDKQAEGGKGLPAEDASNKGEQAKESGLSDYNADALAMFRQSKGGK